MINTIVVGGGQAGIALSYFLKQYGVEHLILERDRAFFAWHNRWDSFRMNTANWMNILPGKQEPFAPSRPWYDVATCEEALDYFRAYIQMVDPPLKEGVAVTQIAEGERAYTRLNANI
jgi:putative flavoprotein involved in K+ transport